MKNFESNKTIETDTKNKQIIIWNNVYKLGEGIVVWFRPLECN